MDKTTVTNSSVPESEESQSKTQTGEGESPQKEVENRIRENLRAEYSRKEVELSKKVNTLESEIEGLKEQENLSKAERDRLNRLESRKDDLENQLEVLETDPQYRPYVEKIKRETERMKQEAKEEAKLEAIEAFKDDMIQQWAEKEGVEFDELYEQLQPYAAKHRKEPLLKRVRLAYQEYGKMKSLLKKEADLQKREAELTQFSEDGQRTTRETTLEEAIKKRDTIAQARKLGL